MLKFLNNSWVPNSKTHFHHAQKHARHITYSYSTAKKYPKLDSPLLDTGVKKKGEF